jgi:hypothetical protein
MASVAAANVAKIAIGTIYPAPNATWRTTFARFFAIWYVRRAKGVPAHNPNVPDFGRRVAANAEVRTFFLFIQLLG